MHAADPVSKQPTKPLHAEAIHTWRRREPGFSESWIGRLIARKPIKLAAVALANKMARIVWALLTRGEVYRTI